MRPNASVLASVLTACAHTGALTEGLWAMLPSVVGLANILSIPIHSDFSTARFVPDEHLLLPDYIKWEREREINRWGNPFGD